MPIYEYTCAGCEQRFELLRPIRRMKAPATCPRCGRKRAQKVLSMPGAVSVVRDWNERANEARRTPYDQAKAQLTNTAREEAERGGRSPRKVTEEAVQATAKAIADKRPRKGAVERQVDAQRAAVKAKKAL